jgi:hypothetical protein
MATTPDSEKTERISWLCATIMILGLLFFLTKINACALACNSCNAKENTTPLCKDEFYEIKNDGYASKHTCTPGARVEVVASPPAPKPGILCHCTNNDHGAQGTQDAGK